MPHTRKSGLFSLRHRRAIILSLVLTALLYLIAVIASGRHEAAQAFAHLGIGGGLVLLTCSFVSYLLRFTRWQYYLRRAGWRLPMRLHLAYYLAGFALTTSPGKAGETIRSVLLRPHGIPYPTSLACFFSERLLDVVVVSLLATLSTFAILRQHDLLVLVLVITLAVIPVIHSPLLRTLLQSLEQRLRPSRLRRLLAHLQDLLHNARNFLAWRPLYLGLFLGGLAWGLQGFAFYYLMHRLGLDLHLPLAMGIYAIGLLAGALSMIPGGIGATEAAMALLLAAAGASTEIAIIVPLINRLTTLWFAVALGLLASAWLSGHRQQDVASEAGETR
ncbi:MAG: lysylphosphatidylglycerol synthase transmembrane domain-containing protein [Gammaproteobacteria bacterium]